MKKEASINPGKKAAVNNALIEVSVIRPNIMRTIDGGIIVPKDPEAKIIPMDKSWSYFNLYI